MLEAAPSRPPTGDASRPAGASDRDTATPSNGHRPAAATRRSRLARLSPRIARAVDRYRRDARMIVGAWRGQRWPLVDRAVRAAIRRQRSVDAARVLRVAEVVRETDDAVSLVLEDPAGRPVAFTPGQFFTVLFDLDGRTHRRAYSASSSHLDTDRVRITTKRVAGGLISNHINDHIRAGQMLRVLGPSGNFTYEPTPGRKARVVLIGGGSGITPLMAIARAVLDGEPDSAVTLLYGNRGPHDIIFRDELARLERAHRGRLRVRHVLEQPPEDWPGGRGRLDRDTLEGELAALGEDTSDAVYYVCGPSPMMDAAREALSARGVPQSRTREERFTSPHLRTARLPANLEPQPVVVRAGGRDHELRAEAGETLLDAGLGAGLPMSFSCAMGGCGACKVVLVEGTVDMEEPNCLGQPERERGYVLACVGRPTSPVKVEVE